LENIYVAYATRRPELRAQFEKLARDYDQLAEAAARAAGDVQRRRPR
jgi:hypothetical protein